MGFWRILAGSFYSPATYARVRYGATGWGFGYSLKLVALTTLLGVGMMAMAFYYYALSPRNGQTPLVDRAILQLAEQMPPFTLENGTLSVEQTAPIYLTLSLGEVGNATIATVDTTGKTTVGTMQTPVLVTATEMVKRNQYGQVTTRSLRDLTAGQPQVVAPTREAVMGLAQHAIAIMHSPSLYAVILPLAWVGVTIVFFITRAFMLLALGGIAMAMMAATRPARAVETRDWVDGVRMAGVAYTPVAVFSALAFAAGFTAIGSTALFAMGALMLFCAISVTKDGA